MTVTARDFINLAMKEAGVLGVGQTLLAEDIDDGFTYLRRMLSMWQRKRWLVPMLYDLTMPGNNLKSNKIGPGQYWNAPRPDKIAAAYIVQRNTGSTPVSMGCRILTSYEDYAKIAVKELNSLPYLVFYDGAYPYGNVYFWPIPNTLYDCHLILKGPVNWQMQIEAGEITNTGSLYTDGAYIAVPLTGGSEGQNSATANITVVGGIVTIVEILNKGQGFYISNVLSADSANIGGTGSGFEYTVTNTSISLDSILNMDEAYEEAIHYNLAVRLCSAYTLPVGKDTKQLAKNGLNTIRMMNAQIAQMVMPAGLVKGKAFNIFNADGY